MSDYDLEVRRTFFKDGDYLLYDKVSRTFFTVDNKIQHFDYIESLYDDVFNVKTTQGNCNIIKDFHYLFDDSIIAIFHNVKDRKYVLQNSDFLYNYADENGNIMLELWCEDLKNVLLKINES